MARLSWWTLHSPRLPCVGERQRCAPCSVQQKPWLRHHLRRCLAPSQHRGTISVPPQQPCMCCLATGKAWQDSPARAAVLAAAESHGAPPSGLSMHVCRLPGTMGAGTDIRQEHPQRLSEAPCEGCLVASAEDGSAVLLSALGVRAPASPDPSSAGPSARRAAGGSCR